MTFRILYLKIFNLAEHFSGWFINLVELCTWSLLTYLNSVHEDFLLEYLDLALDTCSWVLLHISLAFTQIHLYYCKELLWWLFQLQTDFQLTTLNGCSITGWTFDSQIWSRHFGTRWVLCHISVSLFRFLLNHKRHSYNDYSTYMPRFVQFLPAVYPVGVTDLRPFLHKKIDDNSVNLIGFQPKLVQRCALISHLRVRSFSFIEVYFRKLWPKMQTVQSILCLLTWRH